MGRGEEGVRQVDHFPRHVIGHFLGGNDDVSDGVIHQWVAQRRDVHEPCDLFGICWVFQYFTLFPHTRNDKGSMLGITLKVAKCVE